MSLPLAHPVQVKVALTDVLSWDIIEQYGIQSARPTCIITISFDAAEVTLLFQGHVYVSGSKGYESYRREVVHISPGLTIAMLRQHYGQIMAAVEQALGNRYVITWHEVKQALDFSDYFVEHSMCQTFNDLIENGGADDDQRLSKFECPCENPSCDGPMKCSCKGCIG